MRSYNIYSLEQRVTNLERNGGSGEAPIAAAIPYDSFDTGLLANNVQDAIDEVNEKISQGSTPEAKDVAYDNATTGLQAENVQTAIDVLFEIASQGSGITSGRFEENGNNEIGWYINFPSGLLIMSQRYVLRNVAFSHALGNTGLYMSDYENVPYLYPVSGTTHYFEDNTKVQKIAQVVSEDYGIGDPTYFCTVGDFAHSDSTSNGGRISFLSNRDETRNSIIVNIISIGKGKPYP